MATEVHPELLPGRRRPRRPLLAVPRRAGGLMPRPEHDRVAASAAAGRDRGRRRPARRPEPCADAGARPRRHGRSSRSATWSSTSRSAAASCSARSATVQAVDGVSFEIRRGETLGPGRRVGLRQDDGRPAAPAAHRADVRARSASTATDITALKGAALKPYRRRMQIIFQDPYASLDPRTPIGDSIGEGLRIHGLGDAAPSGGPRSAG